jgi:PAS domain S-box-containing protein
MMVEFLKSQLDYIYFFYGASFLLLVPICLFLRRRPYVSLRWSWLAWFGATHGTNEWLDLLALNMGSGLLFDLIRVCLLIISYLCLAEFGRGSMVALRGHGPGRWILAVMGGLAALGGVFGVAGLLVTARYFLGFGGALWAAGTFLLAAQTSPPASRPLQASALGMAGYALATGLVVNRAPFFPASWLNFDSFLAVTGVPIQLVRGVLAVWISISLCLFALTSLNALMDIRLRSWLRKLMWGGMAGMIILLLGGWFVTQYFGEDAREDQREDYRQHAKMLQQAMTYKVEETDRLVRILTDAPAMFPALIKAPLQETRQVDTVLDRCSQALPGSICYLLDLRGLTVASSNRDHPDSFVGQSYAFRPYFQEALQGSPGKYWALGVASKEMGYYSSLPLRDNASRIMGVAVIKRPIEEIKSIDPEHFIGLIVDPSGIVVSANRAELILKSLWPLSDKAKQEIRSSRQFGEGPFAPILTKEPVDGGECQWQGKRLMVMRRALPWKGWSVVMIGPLWPIIEARLLGISLTLLVCLLFVGSLGIVAMTIESAGRVTTSERLYRTLVEGARNCIGLFDREGRFLAVNDNGLAALGWQKENLLGQRFTQIWPEDCQNRVDEALNQVLLRGQQTSFEAPYVRPDGRILTFQVDMNPVFERDMSVEGFVGITNDITERKRAEKALFESEKRFRDVTENSQESVWEVDTEGRFTYISPILEKLLGYKPEELLGKHFYDLFIPEDREQFKEMGLILFAETQPFRELINRHLHKDGHIVYLSTSGAPVFDQTGKFLGYRGAKTDITERKKAEEALQESEKRFRDVIENSQEWVWEVDTEGRFTYVSPIVEKLLGHKPEEILGKYFYDLFIPEEREQLKEMALALFPDKKPFREFISLSLHKDGRCVFLSTSGIPMFDQTGNFLGYRGANTDITERKKAEEALVESEKRFRDVAESALEWVWEVDTEGKYTYASPVVEKLLGYKPEEILDKHFYDLFIPEEREQLKEMALATFAAKQPLRELINRNFHKDGRIVYLSTSGVPILDKTGNLLGYRGADTDITERKKAEEALLESEKRFRQLFESAADILILHEWGKIIEVNQQACLSLGYTREELLRMTIFEIEVGFSKKYLLERWDKEKSTSGVIEVNGVYRRQDGSTFPAEMRVSKFPYRGKNLRLVAGRDISVRKRAEEELRASEEALRKSRESYRNLAGYLLTAHEAERKRLGRELHDDLTQRLAALAMETERLEQLGQTQPATVSPNLRGIREKLARLSMDTHALSRRLHPSVLEDLGLADAIASECRGFVQREGIKVSTRIEGLSEVGSPDVALCIYRIVQEGLRNVAKHARASEVLVSIIGQDGNIHLSIKDNGIGFDPAQIKKKGGLGLASMQERAYIIGADFSVESQPGQGTVIEVLAPLSGRLA